MVDRRCTFAAVTLCLVFLAQGATARPLAGTMTTATAPATATETPMDVGAASPVGGFMGSGEAFGAGKWLPLPALAGGLRFPGVFPLPTASGVGASIPWIGGAPPALAVPAGIPALVPPYVGATRQEQLSVWASLFNPFQVRAPSSTSVQVTGAEPSSRVPAVAGAGLERTTAVGEPAGVAAGEPKWGVFLGTTTPNING